MSLPRLGGLAPGGLLTARLVRHQRARRRPRQTSNPASRIIKTPHLSKPLTMSVRPFVPHDFTIPLSLDTGEFRLRMLSVHDVVKD